MVGQAHRVRHLRRRARSALAHHFAREASLGRKHEQAGSAPLAIESYERAAALYGGDFLSDSPYDEWAAMPREKMRLTYLDVLDRLSRLYLTAGQYASCIVQCQRILEEDNCREDAHGVLIRCYVRQGQPHLALRQFQACAAALKQELGIPPSSATLELHDRIRAGEPV